MQAEHITQDLMVQGTSRKTVEGLKIVSKPNFICMQEQRKRLFLKRPRARCQENLKFLYIHYTLNSQCNSIRNEQVAKVKKSNLCP